MPVDITDRITAAAYESGFGKIQECRRHSALYGKAIRLRPDGAGAYGGSTVVQRFASNFGAAVMTTQ